MRNRLQLSVLVLTLLGGLAVTSLAVALIPKLALVRMFPGEDVRLSLRGSFTHQESRTRAVGNDAPADPLSQPIDTSLLTAAIAPDRPDVRRDGGTAGTARRQEGAFGSVLLPIAALPASRHFKRVAKTLTSCDGGFGCKPAMKLLDTIASDVEGLPFLGRLERVNQTVNTTIRYQPDIKNYRQRDHWAEVPEIVGRRKGDCEDYAILKMAALAHQGVPMTSMSIVVLFDHRNQAFHAVLAVATSAGTYILDNTRADIYLDTTQPDYQPLFSVAQGKAWIHGAEGETVALSFRDIATVRPGEASEVRHRPRRPAAGHPATARGSG